MGWVGMAMADKALVAALRAGTRDLPSDLGALADRLRTVELLLEEKAVELEPSWSEALAVAAEIETLFALEAAIAERAIDTPAHDLASVRLKLEVWKTLAAGVDDTDPARKRDRLVHSIAADLDRL